MSYQPPPNYDSQYPAQQGNYEQTVYPQSYGDAPVLPSYEPLPQSPYGGAPSQSPYAPYASLPPQPAYLPAAAYPLYGVSTAQPERGRRLALAGLVLGIASLLAFVSMFFVTSVIALFAFFWFGGLASSITGVILSALGRRSTSRKTMAIVGLVLSIIALVLGLIFTVVVIIMYAGQHPAP